MNNENKANINWYPGHMAKTKREIKERINLIDLIYEVIDARMPLSSKMKGMDEIIKDKPCILVMTKKDLCDIEETNKWVLEYEKLGYKTILVDLTNNEDYKKLIKLTNEVTKPIQEKEVFDEEIFDELLDRLNILSNSLDSSIQDYANKSYYLNCKIKSIKEVNSNFTSSIFSFFHIIYSFHSILNIVLRFCDLVNCIL